MLWVLDIVAPRVIVGGKKFGVRERQMKALESMTYVLLIISPSQAIQKDRVLVLETSLLSELFYSLK